MGIISWIILGLIAGFIGSRIVDKQGPRFLAQYRAWNHRRASGRLSIRSGRGQGYYRLQHLEYGRCNYWLGGGASDLQCAYRSPPSMVSRQSSLKFDGIKANGPTSYCRFRVALRKLVKPSPINGIVHGTPWRYSHASR